jgi:type 2 lantibiotic biosynthesis protein LanM
VTGNNSIRLYKALFAGERRVRKKSVFSYFRGFKKLRAWRKLSGFRNAPDNFRTRLSFDNLTPLEFCIILGQDNVLPSEEGEISWLSTALAFDQKNSDITYFLNKFPVLEDYRKRGLISPFLVQIVRAITHISGCARSSDNELEMFLQSQLGFIEQLVRRAVVLDLNVLSVKGRLHGHDESEQYQKFIERFRTSDERLAFFMRYPVLFRMVTTKLDFWSRSISEFMTRLKTDRALLEAKFGICREADLKSIHPSGDTHNNGRSVMMVEFSDGNTVVYKPRSTSLEFGFQKYLEFFNSVNTRVSLRRIEVVDQGSYGWVEFVEFDTLKNEREADLYHFKLGFLTAIVFSINGVDIFYENLIAAGVNPVIIDLETMFHASLEAKKDKSPAKLIQSLLHESIAGIGILPQPNVGASDSEVFDVSVMGARTDAQAPYKVTGIENFGRADMRITEIPGWIPDNKSSSENTFSHKRKAQAVFDGLASGFDCVFRYRELLASDGGVIDQCFATANRRLIVRDTKVYGSLQQDETHPDLLRDQIDREWHWDNLWSGVAERPFLSMFVRSELNQLKNGDIPYFEGRVDSLQVSGCDGSVIDLSKITSLSPLQHAKNKVMCLTADQIDYQVRIGATALGLHHMQGITQPVFDSNRTLKDNAITIAGYIISRVKSVNEIPWCDTSFNPIPKARDYDPVRVVPSDPFLYEGISGIAMFLHDLWISTGDKRFLDSALGFAESVFREIESQEGYSASGFVGLSSVVYMINRCIQKADAFTNFEPKLSVLMQKIAVIAGEETRLDFLLGISGISSALLPYVKRTASHPGMSVLQDSGRRLGKAGVEILSSDEPIEGMDCLRGFSHGISGIALTLYRLGEFLNQDELVRLAADLVLHEYSLVKNGEWTDGHSYAGAPLVGWCHGSAGITIALAAMPKLRSSNHEISEYFDAAISNTLARGVYDSKCLCHGTAGNLLCIATGKPKTVNLNALMEQFDADLLSSGFLSFGAAQTMGIGLMTGLTGSAYYLLGRREPTVDFGFLTLS